MGNRRRRGQTPYMSQRKLGCKVWGHATWEPDGYYCLRCGMPIIGLWPSYTNGGVFQRLYHRFIWPLERWWVHTRQPAQRYPFYTRCEDCDHIDAVWTWAVGDHKHCVVFPF
jgi:hypothetical protein